MVGQSQGPAFLWTRPHRNTCFSDLMANLHASFNYMRTCLASQNMASEPSFLDFGFDSFPEIGATAAGTRQMVRRIPRKFSRARPLTEEELDRKRVTANVQERRRMQRLNTALEKLKKAIPQHLHVQYRRLSKIKTLKLAIDYIGFLEEVLTPNFDQQFYNNHGILDANGYCSDQVLASGNPDPEEANLLNCQVPYAEADLTEFSACGEFLQHGQSAYFAGTGNDSEGFQYLEHL